MPFTVSHTIVALPFRRTPVPAAALAIGAMAPDAVVFVPELPPYAVTHSALGALTVSLPIALVVLVAWTFGLRWAVSAVLPAPIRDRLPARWDDPLASWRSFTALGGRARTARLGLVLLTVIAGLYSHIAWDSFTHETGWTVRHVALLRTSVGGDSLYDVLQNVSSVAGMVVLLVAWVLWFRRTMPVARPRVLGAVPARVLRVAVVGVVVLLTLVRALSLAAFGSGPEGVFGWGATVAVRTAAVMLVLLAVALACTGVPVRAGSAGRRRADLSPAAAAPGRPSARRR